MDGTGLQLAARALLLNGILLTHCQGTWDRREAQALPVSALVTMVLHLLRPPFLCASRAAVLNLWVATPLGVAYQIFSL